MALLDIVEVDDHNPVLRRRAKPVKKFSPKVRRLVRNMIETMQQAPGVGLAAPQVGVSQRVIVIDPPQEEEEGKGDGVEESQLPLGTPCALINPEITWYSETKDEGMEGCLSVPGYAGDVFRSVAIRVKARDEWGNLLQFEAHGFPARIIQHETDHLEGVLFIDRTDKIYEIVSEDEEEEEEEEEGEGEREGAIMHPAKRLHRMRESTIREMTRLAIEHEAINLSQGFPDFPAPEVVKQAAVDAIRSDQNQYAITWGLPALRQALATKMKKRYGLSVDPDLHVTVTCGVTEGIVSSLMAIINPGDEVIIIEPFHENFLPAVLFAGGIPVFVPLEPPTYALDTDRLRRDFSSRTRAILINTPHNPTGRVFTQEELQGVADLCQEFDVLAITDEIYEHIIYDGRQHIPLATLPGMMERTITIGGMSKTFAVTGWRLGYVVALEPWSTALRTVHDFTTICAPTPLQHAAVAALGLGDSYYRQMQEEYTTRRKIMLDTLQDVGFAAQPPQGAYYVMGDFSAFHFRGDDHAFARWLTTETGVAVVPGSSFYHTEGLGRHSVRFAFPKQLQTLEEAGNRLRQHLP